jgi:hypothetical protein
MLEDFSSSAGEDFSAALLRRPSSKALLRAWLQPCRQWRNIQFGFSR